MKTSLFELHIEGIQNFYPIYVPLNLIFIWITYRRDTKILRYLHPLKFNNTYISLYIIMPISQINRKILWNCHNLIPDPIQSTNWKTTQNKTPPMISQAAAM